MIAPVERKFVEQFVTPLMRERWLEMLPSKRRQKLLTRLSHHFDFVARQVEKLPVRQGHRNALASVLDGKNVPQEFYVISSRPELDANWLNIRETDWCGYLEPYVAYCPSMQLALFRDEYHYYLLTGNEG